MGYFFLEPFLAFSGKYCLQATHSFGFFTLGTQAWPHFLQVVFLICRYYFRRDRVVARSFTNMHSSAQYNGSVSHGLGRLSFVMNT